MEEDGEETPRTPFWIQSTTNVRRVDLYRRRASSLFFNSGVLIIFLLIVAILSMLVIIPKLIAFSSHIFKPNLVKKSWDSINLVLVLFALAFGFLSRNINKDNNNNNHDNKLRFSENGFGRSRSDLSTGTPVTSPVISTPHQWYDFPEQPIVGLRRHRSTSSYPDLREISPSWNQRRFSDDTHFNYDRYYFRREHDLEDIKDVVHVDTVVGLPQEASFTPVPAAEPVPEVESHSPAPLPPSPPPPPPMPSAPTSASKEKPIRTYHSVEKGGSLEVNKINLPDKETDLPGNHVSEIKEQTFVRKRGKGQRRRARSTEPKKMVSPVSEPETEPSSPPEIMPEIQELEPKTSKVERKRTGNATKEFFTSFYLKKKKRQRQRSVDNLDTLIHHSQPPVKFNLTAAPPPPSPPPPPPMPSPSSLLNNLFTSKKERRKKTSSEKHPPPHTAARVQTSTIMAARAPKPSTTRVSPFVTEKPKVPVKMTLFSGIDDSSSGGESPMSRIPPPPPMPPFKMADWKFPVEGDYVRVQSTLSSGSGSPDGDESQSPSSAVASPLFCPSPDVDTKADTFIARFRAGLKLEKMHSFNQSQGNRMSNLGPGPGPGPAQAQVKVIAFKH